MNSETFFEALKTQYNNRLPFVAYRKTEDSFLKACLQNDDTIHHTSDYSESGFVMTPFNNDEKPAILIPSNHANHIETKGEANLETYVSSRKDIKAGDKKTHKKLVKKGIKATKSGVLQKVVLSRKEIIEVENSSLIDVFKRLLSHYKDAFVYVWYHPKIGLWLGATPETLLSVNGRYLKTMALAGTQDYVDFAHVVWGNKEKEEQQFVVDYIVANLKSNTEELQVGKVKTVKAGNLLHLQTEIRATLNREAVNLNQIINALHPTPAICGLPREKAKQFILKEETYDREFYTGFLGELNMKQVRSRNHNRRNVENSAYQTIKKITDLFVNLRCMQMEGSLAHIYVGGGITKDSVSKYEYRETVSKAKTMKKVL